MDLLSSIRKEGSRGGVDFKWSDVTTSTHRENYLGHSLMAPVGRWQKGRDLNWYAKADDNPGVDGETADEKRARERRDEIRRIKEAEEDALARALGLPVKDRGATGVNAIEIGDVKRIVKETEDADEGVEEVGKAGRRFGEFVGAGNGERDELLEGDRPEAGGIIGRETVRRKERREEREDAGEDRERDRRHRHRHRHERSRDGGERRRQRDGEERRGAKRARSRSPVRGERRHRSRSQSREGRREDRTGRERQRSREGRSRRYRSPDPRDRHRR